MGTRQANPPNKKNQVNRLANWLADRLSARSPGWLDNRPVPWLPIPCLPGYLLQQEVAEFHDNYDKQFPLPSRAVSRYICMTSLL